MLLQGWSIALALTFVVTLLFGVLSSYTAIRVLRYWQPEKDTPLQIRLEEETWLAAALMQFGLFFQILSLVMLVLTADSFSGQLVGAMCATGALTANSFGLPALFVKILLVFLAGFWLLIHQLDMRVESQPLVRHKFLYVLLVLPLLVVDGVLLVSYLANLSPDVITSCCGVLIRPGTNDGYNLLDPFSLPVLLSLFYCLALTLFFSSWWLLKTERKKNQGMRYIHAGGWAIFLAVALWAITIYFSSYIYAMPSHRCPFDILQADYLGIGYPIYGTLFAAVFLGIGGGVAEIFTAVEGMKGPVRGFQQAALRLNLWLLPLFLLLTGYAPLRYFIVGGEG